MEYDKPSLLPHSNHVFLQSVLVPLTMLIIVISCSHSSLSQLYSIDPIHYASQWNSMNIFVTLNVQVIFFHEHFGFCIWLSLVRSGLIIQACASSTGKEWEAFLLLIAVKIVSTLHWVSCIARYRYTCLWHHVTAGVYLCIHVDLQFFCRFATKFCPH